MTRCTEFYEKLEKDGNFCGMNERSYHDAQKYWNDYRHKAEDNGENSPLNENAWVLQQRELNAQGDAEKPKEPKHQNKADFMEEATAFWAKARKYWSEEVIEEVLDKARVNTR